MYGDTKFSIVAAGSMATGSSGLNNFFQSYSGLSLLNNNDVVYIQISAGANEFFLGPSGNGVPAGLISNDVGMKIYPNTSGLDLPPMRVGTASLLQVVRPSGDAASFGNASAGWVIWSRVP